MCSWDKGPVCHIVGGGDFDPERFRPGPGDFVIAADCGYRYLEDLGQEPDLVLGDFDSLGGCPTHSNVMRLPVEKDDTDTLHAVRVGLEKGYTRFVLHGGLGGARFDHAIANIQTLLFLTRQGAKGWLLGGDDTVITALHNDGLFFPAGQKGILSVFCMGEPAEGVTLSGLKYPLKNSTVTSDFPIGVSNEFTDGPAEIRVERGTMLLIWRDKEFCL